jgi:hypothetical protein
MGGLSELCHKCKRLNNLKIISFHHLYCMTSGSLVAPKY